ncbi:response regulator [Halococcoides cellulosivorans]|uniref:Response regulator n=1 Tax=Halococcoides cellulosivorans TaxID=1679096 RepID=A0A2R4X2K4_9EURY|nr:response regulator [Halococcoides cellulosivorans]AWB28021.1 response regulator [Halococcoides cellulosivorans]
MTPDPATVLVIEDERQIADGYASILDDEYEVRIANSGAEGLETIDDTVDVVLLDRMMSGLSGQETLDEMRDRGYDVPVAMVTAKVPDYDVLDMGFDDYLTKPVEVEDLFDTVERLLAMGELDRDLREYVAASVKQASLEATKPSLELEEHQEYRDLRAELTDRGAELGDISAAMTDHQFELVVKTVVRNLQSGPEQL